MPLRVLVADADPVFRAGLVALCAAAVDLTVVAEAGDGREAVRLVRRHQPRAVVMDLALPLLDGAVATREILAARPDTGIVLLVDPVDEAPPAGEPALAAGVQAGALGFVARDALGAELPAAVRAVADGRTFFGATVAPRVLRLARAGTGTAGPVALPELTAREREVLTLVAEGLGNPAIARRLAISPITVRNHLTNILAKLGVRDRRSAAEVARRAGLAPR